MSNLTIICWVLAARILARGFTATRPARQAYRAWKRHDRATRRNGSMLVRPTINVPGDS